MSERTNNLLLIDVVTGRIEDVREALDDVRQAQNDNSDEANEDHIQQAYAALDALEGHVGDIVP